MHLWIGQIFMANFLRRIRQNKTAMRNFLLLLCITQSSDLPVSMKTELLSEESCIYYQRHQISGIRGPLHAPFFPFTAARYYFCRQLLGPIWTCDIRYSLPQVPYNLSLRSYTASKGFIGLQKSRTVLPNNTCVTHPPRHNTMSSVA